MKNAVCIVTGSSSGLGKETAKRLAGLRTNLVLLSRDKERGRSLFMEIKAAGNNASVDWIPADLASIESVRTFVRTFRNRYDRLDVLFNCGGALLLKRITTPDGLEGNFATNYLGHFLLTNLLLEPLRNSPRGRVITLSSRGTERSRGIGSRRGAIDFENLQGLARYRFSNASGQAVLAKILMTYEMARRWKNTGIEVCVCRPGLTRTEPASSLPARSRALTAVRFAVHRAQAPDQAADQILQLAFSATNVNGRYYESIRGRLREARSSIASYDPNTASRLWAVSEALVGQKFPAVK